MEFFHAPVQIISRQKGRSAVAAAAYRSGIRIECTWDGRVHDYTRKQHIVYSEIMLPPQAPREFYDRATLWNSVEWNESKRNNQLAREMELALPAELSREEQIKLVQRFVQKTFVDDGMCSDFSIHDKNDGNPHAHIMLTMRPLTEDGLWGDKSRMVYELDENGERIRFPSGNWKSHKENTTDWDNRNNVEKWRAAAADFINEALRENGFTTGFVDHRSYARQGKKQIPMVHEGPAVCEMEKRGIVTELGSQNRKIREWNRMTKQYQARLTKLNAWAMADDLKKYKGVHKKWLSLPEKKKDAFYETYRVELMCYEAAERYLKQCKADGEVVDVKKWKEALNYCYKDNFSMNTQ